MATTDVEIDQLRARVSRLEHQIRELAWRLPRDEHSPHDPPADTSSRDDMEAWLSAMGLTREPTDDERELAAEWDQLPEAEKATHIRLMESLDLDPPLSQIIAEGRR